MIIANGKRDVNRGQGSDASALLPMRTQKIIRTFGGSVIRWIRKNTGSAVCGMTISTERLTIRRVRAGDWKAIQGIWADQSRSVYAQYDRPSDLEDASVERRIAKWASFANGNEHIFFAVCLKESPIGYVSLNRRENGYEMGYCFHSGHHGHGYARESISALLDLMKTQGVSRITAGTALGNTPSVRLLLFLGFTQTGTEKVSFYRDANGDPIVFDGGLYELRLHP